jgi:beta-aspartyl-peptidase (threonine type)
MVNPFIVGSDSAKDFLQIGIEILKRKGTALDAVEETCRAVESNPNDHGVGLGGIPNLLGRVALDSSIMDGKTLAAGSVAHVEGYLHVISIARRVMELTPHVLLVGKGAELFAETQGFEKQDLLTDYSRKFYEAFKAGRLKDLGPEYKNDLGYLMEDEVHFNYSEWYRKLRNHALGTVDVMALDHDKNICVGVTTSGTYLKLPGRVGDSPIIGAGNYCDNKYGAAACTGRGELSIRNGTARIVVAYMKQGMFPEEACIEAMREVNELDNEASLNVIAFNPEGNVASASTYRDPPIYYMNSESMKVETRKGVWVIR